MRILALGCLGAVDSEATVDLAIPAQTFFDELVRRGIKISERIEKHGPVA